MNKRSATVLALGVALALLATAFALSVTARPSASAQGAVQAPAPRVRTITKTVTVHRTRDVAIGVPGEAVWSSTGEDPSAGAEDEHEEASEGDHYGSEGFDDHGGEHDEGGFDD